ncbi:MAG TPA: hypothetical protein VH373_07450 [Jatrophihabitantaceae bacterium]|jgi:hypothetical protein
MSIALTDIADAVHDYLATQVTVEITKVTARLEPLEEGTFTVQVTNAAAPAGVELTDLAFHVTVTDPTIIDILALDDPAGIHTTRENANPNSAVVKNGDPAPNGEMCVFLNTDDLSTLEIGESTQVELDYRAKKAGDTSIKCHIHATVDQNTLFPPNQPGVNDEHQVKVLT